MSELTGTTTRREYLAHLARSYARSAPFGGNTAILNHVVKLHGMTDHDWVAHRAGLLAARHAAGRAAAVSTMAGELVALGGASNG